MISRVATILFVLALSIFTTGLGPLQPSQPGGWLDYALGRFPNTIPVRKFGINRDISAAQDIWPVAANLTYLTTAAQLEIVSSSVNDTAAGTHCQKVKIFGLDGNYDLVEEEESLAGQSASTATTQTFLRVYRAYCSQVGTYGNTNDGNITIRVASAGSTQAYIEAGDGQTQGSHYTIPRGYTGYGMDVHANVASNKFADISFYYRVNDGTTHPAWRIAAVYEGVTSGADYTYWGMVPFPEKTDIRAVGDPAAANTGVSIDYIILLVRNNR